MDTHLRLDFSRLDARRQARGYTWRRLAGICAVMGWRACTERYLLRLIDGIQPVPEHLATLADALGCRVADICSDGTQDDAPHDGAKGGK